MKSPQKQRRLEKSLLSMIRNHEQWVYWEIKYEDYKNENDWNQLKTQKPSVILTHRAVVTVPTFLVKLSLPRVQECRAAKLKCCEIHEKMWLFLETFLIVNMLDEILMNYTMIQEIWQHHQESLTMSTILRKERIEKSGSEEPLRSTLLTCFSVRARRKSLDVKWFFCLSLMSMTNRAVGIGICIHNGMTIPSYLSSEMHLQKIPWPNGIPMLDREFPSRSLRKGEESRARIAVDQENRSNQLAGWPHQSEINYGVKNSLIMKNWIWWWRQNWNGATISIRTSKRGSASKSRELKRTTDFSEEVRLLIWSTKLQSMEPWQKERSNILTRSGRLENVFSGRQLGLAQGETLVVCYTRMPRETVRTTWDEVERRKKISLGGSILFSTESEETDWRERLFQSKG